MSLLHDLNPGVEQTQQFISSAWRRALFVSLLSCGVLASVPAALAWLAGFALHRWGGWSLSQAGWLAVGTGVIALGWIFAHRFPSRQHVILAIDEKLHLKDRVKSSLEFMQLAQTGVLHEWQIADTGRHLSGVDTGQVFPVRWTDHSRKLWLVVGLLACTLLLRLLPAPPPPEALPADPLRDLIAQEANALAEDMEELEEALSGSEDEDLEELAKKLEEMQEALREEDTGLEEAMELLGDMRQEMEEAAAALNTDLAEKLMAEMGEAMQEHADTREAGKELEKGDYDAAAEELRELAKQAREDAKALQERNKGLAKKLSKASKAGKGRYAESMQELAEALEGMEGQPLDEALEGQAADLENLQQMKGLQQMMQQQLAKMGQMRKGLGQAQAQMPGQGSQPGSMLGMMPGAGKMPGQTPGVSEMENNENSDSPSLTAGKGSADEPFGDATDASGQARDEALSGIHGQGPSQVMTEIALEGVESAGRSFKEVYAEYRKQSDEILEAENLPPGYQSVIRDYFEAIRPTREEAGGPR